MIKERLVKLSDYSEYPFRIPSIELDFSLHEDHVKVLSVMQIEPLSLENTPLVLKGVQLELESVFVNGSLLSTDLYRLSSEELVIQKISERPFKLSISCKINPFNNSSLEGLYLSGDLLTTQCEAEGFRRICYHPDRPDVLSKYQVRIEANAKKYPALLSNGNLIRTGKLQNDASRHEALWMDPFPKPSYLFALVAGTLNEVKGTYKTSSGKSIILRLHVEAGDEIYTAHALQSLRRAMAWDESVYGLEYDLNEYNIVAVRHFNMGAMENKSLNIFNSKLILADSSTATDSELERIESVVAHEYFHNWTGNRITCRDWFQLSLKEGLTVFRDQSFTSDLHSAAVKRIEDVSFLRNTQFREDSGPTSHAVKPGEYLSIDNFYTTTIYEKGAELIRMLKTLVGQKSFMCGIDLYVKRFDGCAATTEDFVNSIYDAALLNKVPINFDINQFKLWYYQSGTPEVLIQREWDSKSGKLIIKCKQIFSSSSKEPLVIPILLLVISSEGRLSKEHLLILDQREQVFCLENLPIEPKKPAISIFRNFSAPVKWDCDLSRAEYLELLKSDDDPFSRWEAGQSLIRESILARASLNPDIELEESLIFALDHLVSSCDDEDPNVIASLLSIPGLAELEDLQTSVNPIALYEARMSFKEFLGRNLANQLRALLDKSRVAWSKNWPLGQGERKLTALAWDFLAAAGDSEILNESMEAVSGNSMTLARAALLALQPIDCGEREIAMKTFFDRWKEKPVILDTWFGLEASTPRDDGLERVKELLVHPKFDPMAPNAIRAVLGGFSANTKLFHAIDGSGYNFMADQLAILDLNNPITASRLSKVFSRWKSYTNPHSEEIYRSLKQMSKLELSANTREVISLMLN